MKKRKPDYYSTPIEYEILEGRPILILKRKTEDGFTVPCPFCGMKHKHSKGDGHRAGHCRSDSREWGAHLLYQRELLEAPDGTILYKRNGYIIVKDELLYKQKTTKNK